METETRKQHRVRTILCFCAQTLVNIEKFCYNIVAILYNVAFAVLCQSCTISVPNSGTDM